MSANIIDKGSCGPQTVLLRPPQDLVDNVIKDNHQASLDLLLDTLYEGMKERDGSYFVAILPCLVVFGLSSELDGAGVSALWDHGHEVIIWSHDKRMLGRVCQPQMTESTAVLHASSLEDWLQSGCVPEGTKKLLILASEGAVRSCERWKEASIEQMQPTEFSNLGELLNAKYGKATATTPGSRSQHQKGAYLDGEI